LAHRRQVFEALATVKPSPDAQKSVTEAAQ